MHWARITTMRKRRLLLRAGANVNAANRYGVPPLIVACTNGNAAVVKLLLEAGADANTTVKGGETALMIASRSGKVDAVKALLVRGARHDARERRGQTALMWAAAEGHAPVVKALIEAGADIRATIDSGFTPFLFAVREGHIDVVRALLEAGANVNEPLRRREKTPGGPVDSAIYKAGRDTPPLLLAVQNGHFELAIALVEAGANPNDVQSGFTPLHTLTWVRKPDSSDVSDPSTPVGSGRLTSLQFVREIVKRGANVNFRLDKSAPKLPNTSSRIDSEGATPFLLAADRADVPLMRTLVEAGADPMLPNFTNTTPLMAAAGLGTTEPLEEAGEEPEALEAVKMLLDLGAKRHAVDNNGAPRAWCGTAPTNRRKDAAERGADPQSGRKKQVSRTPLFLAEGNRAVPLPITADRGWDEAMLQRSTNEVAAGIWTFEKPAPTVRTGGDRSEIRTVNRDHTTNHAGKIPPSQRQGQPSPPCNPIRSTPRPGRPRRHVPSGGELADDRSRKRADDHSRQPEKQACQRSERRTDHGALGCAEMFHPQRHHTHIDHIGCCRQDADDEERPPADVCKPISPRCQHEPGKYQNRTWNAEKQCDSRRRDTVREEGALSTWRLEPRLHREFANIERRNNPDLLPPATSCRVGRHRQDSREPSASRADRCR